MEYTLAINEETVPVTVEMEGETNFRAMIGDNAYEVACLPISENRLGLTVNGQRVSAYVSDTKDGKEIFINGKSYFVRDADAKQTETRKTGQGQGPSIVTPPMPAVVISVLVKPGDAVEKGQAVVVVSAMKMETTLNAPFAGTVTKVNVNEGDKVMPGDVLVDIERREAA